MNLELQATPGDAASTIYFPVVDYIVCPPPRSSPTTGTPSDPPHWPPLGLDLRRASSRMEMILIRQISF